MFHKCDDVGSIFLVSRTIFKRNIFSEKIRENLVLKKNFFLFPEPDVIEGEAPFCESAALQPSELAVYFLDSNQQRLLGLMSGSDIEQTASLR